MEKQLKEAIVNFIMDNDRSSQLPNRTIEHFGEYIYNSKGEYLIGGEKVANFIYNAIKLLLEID